MSEIHDLSRFLEAQEDVYPQAVEELKNGQKQSHWMWFIFPQLKGLGSSPTAQKYAIQDLDEARAYWQHPVLSKRLVECSRLIMRTEDKNIKEIFGYPDYLKLNSCMTLFRQVSDEPVFKEVISKHFDNREDNKTLELLNI
jgi:uncharacterized protein (DUF1810 family)